MLKAGRRCERRCCGEERSTSDQPQRQQPSGTSRLRGRTIERDAATAAEATPTSSSSSDGPDTTIPNAARKFYPPATRTKHSSIVPPDATQPAVVADSLRFVTSTVLDLVNRVSLAPFRRITRVMLAQHAHPGVRDGRLRPLTGPWDCFRELSARQGSLTWFRALWLHYASAIGATFTSLSAAFVVATIDATLHLLLRRKLRNVSAAAMLVQLPMAQVLALPLDVIENTILLDLDGDRTSSIRRTLRYVDDVVQRRGTRALFTGGLVGLSASSVEYALRQLFAECWKGSQLRTGRAWLDLLSVLTLTELGALLATPLHVVHLRLITDEMFSDGAAYNRSALRCARRTYDEEGWRGLFGGGWKFAAWQLALAVPLKFFMTVVRAVFLSPALDDSG